MMSGENPLTTIAIIDDDPLSVEFLVMHLGVAGFKAIVARNGSEMLELIRTGKSRIVIADWIMPEMDGLDLCKAIRSLKNLDYVYFIMLTILQSQPRLVEAFEAGVDDFLSKPIRLEELVARLRAGIRMIRIQERLKEDARSRARLNKKLAKANKRLQRLSATDDLTGLPNRRYAMLRLQEEWARAERSGQPFACALIDVDVFKNINDAGGHLFGDAVLRQIGAALRSTVRGGDALCRFGGDEFLVIFHNQKIQAAAVSAERCRLMIENQSLAQSGQKVPISISIGVAQKEPGMAGPDDLLQNADKALYAAKHSGKNAVWIWEANGSDFAVSASHARPMGLLVSSVPQPRRRLVPPVAAARTGRFR